jgi:hypothetical protein
MKMVNNELNSALIRAREANKETEDEAKKAKVEAALKQSKYAILKPEGSLTEQQKLKLEEVRQVAPLLAEMHQQKEDFRNVFEKDLNSIRPYKLAVTNTIVNKQLFFNRFNETNSLLAVAADSSKYVDTNLTANLGFVDIETITLDKFCQRKYINKIWISRVEN